MKILVARMDGSSRSGFAHGAIKPQQHIPVTRNFDPRLLPIGTADITVEGEQVFADVTLFTPMDVNGLFPALGGRDSKGLFPKGDGYVHREFDVLTVALCDSPNVDPAIPWLSGV